MSQALVAGVTLRISRDWGGGGCCQPEISNRISKFSNDVPPLPKYFSERPNIKVAFSPIYDTGYLGTSSPRKNCCCLLCRWTLHWGGGGTPIATSLPGCYNTCLKDNVELYRHFFKFFICFRHTGSIECVNSLGLVYFAKENSLQVSF